MKTVYFLFITILLASPFFSVGQITIEDVSPTFDNTTFDIGPGGQSVSGKALCVAASADGTKVYLGGHSGVWRSNNSGLSWEHSERPQPGSGGCDAVSGGLLVPNVYDLLVSPANKNVVLAATGKDIHRVSKSGVYRSADGAKTWTLVHQFIRNPGPNAQIGDVGCLAVAPDDPALMFAAGQFSVGKSIDGGLTWTESIPQPNATVRFVVCGPQQGAVKRVYAVGSGVWYSQDGGLSWQRDPVTLTLSFPTDAVGLASRAVAIHPTNPRILYIAINEGEDNLVSIWRGDFSNFNANGSAVWTKLPTVPTGYGGTTASGGNYVQAHVAPNGQFYLIASDRRTVHLSVGEPSSTNSWKRIDGGNAHVDPHGIALTANFQYFDSAPKPNNFGRIYMVNDGGVVISSDGGKNWIRGKGLSTLGIVNVAILPNSSGAPGICIGMGDNSGFFTGNGGKTWRTQEYRGGDNDCTFSDPRQPSRLIVFAPRSGPGIFTGKANKRRDVSLYVNNGGIPNGAVGTGHKKTILGPPALPGKDSATWNTVSSFFTWGYRPLILTLDSESPRPDGDFITIRQTPDFAKLLRTTSMSQISSHQDWVTNATTEGAGTKVFQQGPNLPNNLVNVVQASGGHEAPVFYVSDAQNQKRLWKWRSGMAAWTEIVPVAVGATGPRSVQQFFVDPYRPNILYVLDTDHVYRSNNGGTTWSVDTELELELTDNGSTSVNVSADPNPGRALLRDMIFDPVLQGYRFAIGPVGVFYTSDGATWKPLLQACAMLVRPNNAYYDRESNPCIRALYVTTSNAGLLKITGLPPDTPYPFGSLLSTEGKVNLLRVHELGSKYGPSSDQIDVEAVIQLDTEPGKAFGFQLRNGKNGPESKGMLDLLRDSFAKGRRVRIDYKRTGCENGTILRVMQVE